jgi:two-component system sensor histidine kinase UhpB
MVHSVSRPQAVRPEAVGAFIASYLLAVRLSEHVWGSLAVPSPFWLPDAVLLCALLLTPAKHWWIFAGSILPIRLLAGAVPGTPIWFQFAAIGNDAVKAIVAAWLLRRLVGPRVRLDTLNEFFIFLGVAAVVMPALSALAAAPLRYMLGDPLWRAMYQWFLGDALAQVIFAPAILYWSARAFRHRPARLAEFLILMAALGTASAFAFVLIGRGYSLSLVYLPVPLLIWAAVRLRPFGTANAIALVAVISMLGAVRGTGMFADATGSSVLSLQLFLLVLGVSLLSLAILIAEREALGELEVDFNSRLLAAQEHERARIARELHDDVGQRMALLQFNLTRFSGTADLSPAALHEVNELVDTTSQIVSALRSLSHELHPATLDIVGLEIAIKGLCRDFQAQHGLQIEYRSRNVPARLERAVSICAFRIAQEALRNVVKHSGADAAVVELASEGNRLVLSVSDSGNGFDISNVDERAGLGLISMRERLRLIKGRLSIQSMPRAGTRIRVEVPLDGPIIFHRVADAAGTIPAH